MTVPLWIIRWLANQRTRCGLRPFDDVSVPFKLAILESSRACCCIRTIVAMGFILHPFVVITGPLLQVASCSFEHSLTPPNSLAQIALYNQSQSARDQR